MASTWFPALIGRWLVAGARHSPETQQRCSDVRVHPLPSPSPSTRAPTVLPPLRSWPGIITGQTAPFLFPPRLELRTSRSTGSTGSLRCYLQIRGEAYNENLSSPRCVIVTTCWTTEENESSRLKVFEFRDRKPDFESISLNWRGYIGNRDLLICSLRILEKNGNGKKISFRDSISSECIFAEASAFWKGGDRSLLDLLELASFE